MNSEPGDTYLDWRELETIRTDLIDLGQERSDEDNALLANIVELFEQVFDIDYYVQNQPTTVREDWWVDYCREWAEDQGVPDHIAPYVDWEAYAEALRSDYSDVTFGGYTYYARG